MYTFCHFYEDASNYYKHYTGIATIIVDHLDTLQAWELFASHFELSALKECIPYV